MSININATAISLQSQVIEIYANLAHDPRSSSSPQFIRLFATGRKAAISIPNVDIQIDLSFDDAERLGNRLLSLVGK